MYLLVQITITKSYKLRTIIIHTKMTNNNDISFKKSFTMKILKKGSLMMMLKKVLKSSLIMAPKSSKIMISKQFKQVLQRWY